MKQIVLIILINIFSIYTLLAQKNIQKHNPWKFKPSFGIQSDIHLSTDDDIENKWNGNTYIDGKLRNNYIEMGVRFEELSNPFPGHEIEKGWGLPHFHLKGNYKGTELTIGDVYEQFGSGLLLRLYEDRPLGIDNAVRGGKINVSSIKGIVIKAIAGQQRKHFDRDGKVFNHDRGYILGGDIEFSLGQWIKPLINKGSNINVGFSAVSKYEKQSEIIKFINGQYSKLNQPENVATWSSRVQMQYGNWDLYSEYAHKYNDPNATNGYTFNSGSAVTTTLSYSQKGVSILLGGRRSDNFDFRSAREETQNDLKINYLQPFTQQHTYTLATLYPYATQSKGEWAFQSEIRYILPKKSTLGGKYGTALKLSGSYICALKNKGKFISAEEAIGTNGNETEFWSLGNKYFHDINLEISKKISRNYRFTLNYMNQSYNQYIIEGHAENGNIVKSNIFIYEGKHKINKKLNLRTELQYLTTQQAQKDWIYGIVELSVLPYFIFSVSDQYNIGDTKKHYYMVSVTGMHKAHRLQLSYGKTRMGINCSGGVCRLMPQTQGLYLSYNFTF